MLGGGNHCENAGCLLDAPFVGFCIAAPHSGAGKTTVTLGLLAALRRRGLVVQPFKCGPDYIDPGHHRQACGVASRNLDTWMMGEAGVRDSYARAASQADVAVIEGVMGLFDGASPNGLAGSSAHVCQLLDVPVILVVNAKAMARSIAPLVKGFTEFKAGVRIVGVIANNVTTESHAHVLAEALASSGLPPLLGCLPPKPEWRLPERHLGLIADTEAGVDDAWFQALADGIEKHIGIAALMRLCGTNRPQPEGGARFVVPVVSTAPGADEAAPSTTSGKPGSRVQGSGHFPPEPRTLNPRDSHPASPLATESPWLRRASLTPPTQHLPPSTVRLGIARDAAFHFYYEDNLDLLREAGAELVPFSPLADAALPTGLDGLYIGGGFPEMFARELAKNGAMRESVRAFAVTGAIYAECGGLMYLGRTLTDGEGRSWDMVGALPVHTGMGKRAQRLGYIEATTLVAGLLGPKGTLVRGHEFHWSAIEREDESVPSAYTVRTVRNGKMHETGLCTGHVWASYLHLHFASQPQVAANWVNHLRVQSLRGC